MLNSVKTVLLLGLMTGLLLLAGGLMGGRGGMIIAFFFAVVMNFTSYWASDKIVLAVYRAREVSRDDDPELHDIVEQLAARASIPRPRIYRIPGAAMNAFATGRDPAHAVVAVTDGLRRALDREELEGVLAHELSHVIHRDILISTVAATLAGAIMMMATMARWGAIFGGFSRRDDDDGGLVGLLAAAFLAPIAAVLIQMAVSRSREFHADASVAALAGNPYGLARALEKLEHGARARPLKAAPATSHLFIVHPFLGGMGRLFSTHPSTAERIRRLTGRVPLRA